MSIKLNQEAVAELQKKYDYLINYESDDPSDPIDPLTYVDSNGDNLLHIAAQLGDVRTIGLLLDAGMNVDLPGDMGFTALHYAYKSKSVDAVRLLLDHGASTTIQNGFGKMPGQ
jgi:ankyrin repeat protein